jgi:hypothetical protein
LIRVAFACIPGAGFLYCVLAIAMEKYDKTPEDYEERISFE